MEIVIALIFVLLILVGVPIAFCLAATGILGLLFFTNIPLALPAGNLYHSLDTYTLIAVPLFFIAGGTMAAGGLARRLVNVAQAITAFLRGGLGVAAVVACGIFASITGSSTTALVAIGSVMYGAMLKAGYSPKFSAGVLTTSGSLGILIPPSVPMIVFAHIANISVGKMFLAGVVPGIIVVILLSVVAYLTADSKEAENEHFSWRQVGVTFWEGLWAILLPVVVLGGIYGGLFTVTEAAGVSVIYALFVELVIYRELTWRDLPRLFDEAVLLSGAIMIIIACATFFGQYLTLQQLPQKLAALTTEHIDSRFALLLAINALLLFVGTFMDIISAMLILAPILIAVATRFQIDLIHLGIIFVINMEIGFMTPPLGLNLFAAQAITKMKIGELVRAVVPTVGVLLVVLLAVTFFPEVALWLPNWFYR
jgi:C4-dicarboxylate transporter DctM subunit